ncbi:MAG TPA: hypothetical protein VH859_08900, partial [Candidatus Limnocylindria bacterium]
SGRLAQPFVYARSSIVAPDDAPAAGMARHGDVAPDFAAERVGASRERFARLRDVLGDGFVLLLAGFPDATAARAAAVRASRLSCPIRVRVVSLDADRALRDVTVLRADPDAVAPYAAAGPRAWLIRPDGHVAGSLSLASAADVDRVPELAALAIGAGRPATTPRPRRAARPTTRTVPVRPGGD